MKINMTTMLIEDFGDIDQRSLYRDITLLVSKGEVTDLVRKVVEEWRVACGLDDRQWLFVLTTLFPQKVLISLIECGTFNMICTC